MGFNTVAFFLNDSADVLDREPEAVLSMLRRCMVSGQGTDRFGGPGQMQVLPSCHADTVQIVAAGGNTIKVLGYGHWRDTPEHLVRKLADDLGFRLVRKSRS